MEKIKKILSYDLSSVIIPLAVLFILLSLFGKGFLSSYNVLSLMQTVSIYVLIGMAQMTVLALGQFNLAIGSIGTLTSVAIGITFQETGLPIVFGVLIGLGVSLLCGALQGALIAKTGINPFIITLSLLSVFKGIATVISKGNSFQVPDFFAVINNIKFGPVPLTFLIALAVVGVMFIVIRYKNIGIHLQAVGANYSAAQYSGIPASAVVIAGHAISGLLCGIAAILQVMRFGSAQLAVGDDWMMQSFVVAVLGGSLLSGGKITVIGTLLGSILVVFINNALVLFHVNTYAFQAIMGIVLLCAYEMDRVRVRLNNKRIMKISTKGKEGSGEK